METDREIDDVELCDELAFWLRDCDLELDSLELTELVDDCVRLCVGVSVTVALRVPERVEEDVRDGVLVCVRV